MSTEISNVPDRMYSSVVKRAAINRGHTSEIAVRIATNAAILKSRVAASDPSIDSDKALKLLDYLANPPKPKGKTYDYVSTADAMVFSSEVSYQAPETSIATPQTPEDNLVTFPAVASVAPTETSDLSRKDATPAKAKRKYNKRFGLKTHAMAAALAVGGTVFGLVNLRPGGERQALAAGNTVTATTETNPARIAGGLSQSGLDQDGMSVARIISLGSNISNIEGEVGALDTVVPARFVASAERPSETYFNCGPALSTEAVKEYAKDLPAYFKMLKEECPQDVKDWYVSRGISNLDNVDPAKAGVAMNGMSGLRQDLEKAGYSQAEINRFLNAPVHLMPYRQKSNPSNILLTEIAYHNGPTGEYANGVFNISQREDEPLAFWRNEKGELVVVRMKCAQPDIPQYPAPTPKGGVPFVPGKPVESPAPTPQKPATPAPTHSPVPTASLTPVVFSTPAPTPEATPEIPAPAPTPARVPAPAPRVEIEETEEVTEERRVVETSETVMYTPPVSQPIAQPQPGVIFTQPQQPLEFILAPFTPIIDQFPFLPPFFPPAPPAVFPIPSAPSINISTTSVEQRTNVSNTTSTTNTTNNNVEANCSVVGNRIVNNGNICTTETVSSTPVATSTPRPTDTPLPLSPTPAKTVTPGPTSSATPEAPGTLTPSPVPSSTPITKESPTPIPTVTNTPVINLTATPTRAASPTPGATATATEIPTVVTTVVATPTTVPPTSTRVPASPTPHSTTVPQTPVVTATITHAHPTEVPQTPVATSTVGITTPNTPGPISTRITFSTPVTFPTAHPTEVPQTPVATSTVGTTSRNTPVANGTRIATPVAAPTYSTVPVATAIPRATSAPSSAESGNNQAQTAASARSTQAEAPAAPTAVPPTRPVPSPVPPTRSATAVPVTRSEPVAPPRPTAAPAPAPAAPPRQAPVAPAARQESAPAAPVRQPTAAPAVQPARQTQPAPAAAREAAPAQPPAQQQAPRQQAAAPAPAAVPAAQRANTQPAPAARATTSPAKR